MWIVVSLLGMEPTPPALEAQSLNPWTTKEVPPLRIFLSTDPLTLFVVHKSPCVRVVFGVEPYFISIIVP